MNKRMMLDHCLVSLLALFFFFFLLPYCEPTISPSPYQTCSKSYLRFFLELNKIKSDHGHKHKTRQKIESRSGVTKKARLSVYPSSSSFDNIRVWGKVQN